MWRIRLFLLCLYGITCAIGQGQTYHFERFSLENGLSDNNVTCIVKDQRGFLWLGTLNGLNRFDGRNFKHYFNQPGDKGSLPSNFLIQMMEEPDKSLRINTRNGYSIYHSETDSFESFLTYPASFDKLGEANFFSSKRLPDGSFWLVNYLGKTYFYSAKTNRAVPFEIPDDPKLYPGISQQTRSFNFNVFEAQLSGDSICWFGTTYGLVRYHIASKRFKFYPQLSTSFGTLLHLDADGQPLLTVWEDGVFSIDPATDQLKRFYEKQPKRPDNIVWDMLPQPDGSYWLACEGGLFELEKRGGRIRRIALPADGQFPTRVNCLLREPGGIIWLGTENGLVKMDPKLQGFRYLPLRTDSQQVYENDIYAVQKIENKLFAVSRHYNGIYILPLDNSYAKAAFQPTPERDPSCLLKTANGKYWLTTWNGLYAFDPNTLKLTSTHPPPRRESRKGLNWALAENPLTGELWCGSSRDGIFVYNPETGRSQHLSCVSDGFCALDVRDIVFDRNGRKAWVSTIANGLWEYDLPLKTWRQFKQKNTPQLPHDYTSDLVQDKEGRLWIGTLNGLCCYDWQKPVEDAFRVFSIRDGLPSNFMEGLQLDNEGNIWAGSAGRIVRVNPLNGSVGIFDHRYGTDVTPFSLNSISLLDNGLLAGGGKGGVLLWSPDSLKTALPSGDLFLTEVTVLGKPYAAQTPVEMLKSLHLAYWQNVLTLHFANLNFTLPDFDVFYWKLEGYDKDWVSGGNLRAAVYSNLPPGAYTFKVKSANREGVWSPEKTLLYLHIQPAFWQTIYFKTLIIGLLVFSGWLAYRWRIRQIKEKEALKTAFQKRIAEVEMSALRAQMNPHFVFNCLNSINSFIQLSDPDMASAYLTKFSRLIRLVLDNSREELVPLHQELEALRLYVELEALRFDGRFSFDIQVNENLDIGGIDIPPLLIQPYVENAIWHGLMHKTTDEGKLSLKLFEFEGKLWVVIEDNGIGRAEAARLKSKNATLRKSLGMAVTKERMEIIRKIYRNEISVEIVDLVLPDGQPGGTKIILKMDM